MKIPDKWNLTPLGAEIGIVTGFAFKSREYSDNIDCPRLIRGDNTLDRWYRKRAQERFEIRYEVCSKEMLAYDINASAMHLQRMAKRWGSYSPSGRILLNPELVKAPTECIDYVILHELCHVKHRGHNKQFYKLLQRVVPDWLRLKYRLEHLPL